MVACRQTAQQLRTDSTAEVQTRSRIDQPAVSPRSAELAERRADGWTSDADGSVAVGVGTDHPRSVDTVNNLQLRPHLPSLTCWSCHLSEPASAHLRSAAASALSSPSSRRRDELSCTLFLTPSLTPLSQSRHLFFELQCCEQGQHIDPATPCQLTVVRADDGSLSD